MSHLAPHKQMQTNLPLPVKPPHLSRKGGCNNLVLKTPARPTYKKMVHTPLHTPYPNTVPEITPSMRELWKHAATGDIREVEALLNLAPGLIASENTDGWNSLHFAANALSDNFDVIELLVERNADVDSTNQLGNTPLQVAAVRGNGRCIDSLIHSGADIDKRNKDCKTALHTIAVLEDREEIGNLLVRNNANRYLKCKDGKTPGQIARQFGKGALASIISCEEAKSSNDKNDSDANSQNKTPNRIPHLLITPKQTPQWSPATSTKSFQTPSSAKKRRRSSCSFQPIHFQSSASPPSHTRSRSRSHPRQNPSPSPITKRNKTNGVVTPVVVQRDSVTPLSCKRLPIVNESNVLPDFQHLSSSLGQSQLEPAAPSPVKLEREVMTPLSPPSKLELKSEMQTSPLKLERHIEDHDLEVEMPDVDTPDETQKLIKKADQVAQEQPKIVKEEVGEHCSSQVEELNINTDTIDDGIEDTQMPGVAESPTKDVLDPDKTSTKSESTALSPNSDMENSLQSPKKRKADLVLDGDSGQEAGKIVKRNKRDASRSPQIQNEVVVAPESPSSAVEDVIEDVHMSSVYDTPTEEASAGLEEMSTESASNTSSPENVLQNPAQSASETPTKDAPASPDEMSTESASNTSSPENVLQNPIQSPKKQNTHSVHDVDGGRGVGDIVQRNTASGGVQSQDTQPNVFATWQSPRPPTVKATPILACASSSSRVDQPQNTPTSAAAGISAKPYVYSSIRLSSSPRIPVPFPARAVRIPARSRPNRVPTEKSAMPRSNQMHTKVDRAESQFSCGLVIQVLLTIFIICLIFYCNHLFAVTF